MCDMSMSMSMSLRAAPLQGGQDPQSCKPPKRSRCTLLKRAWYRRLCQGTVSALARTEVLVPAGTARTCRVRFRPLSLLMWYSMSLSMLITTDESS
jgi:hypothetical protein